MPTTATAPKIDAEGMRVLVSMGRKPSVRLIHDLLDDPVTAVHLAGQVCRTDQWDHADCATADEVARLLCLELVEFLPANRAPIVKSCLKLLGKARACIAEGARFEERALRDIKQMVNTETADGNYQ